MNLRWDAARHEAGHAVTALALGGEVRGLTITQSGAGLCRSMARLRSDMPLVTAGGDAGTAILADEPPPEIEGESVSPRDESIPLATIATDAACEESLLAFGHAEMLDDDQHLRRYASQQGEPETWCDRFYYFKFAASRIIDEQRAAVLAIAAELYRRGQLDGREVTEIYTREKR